MIGEDSNQFFGEVFERAKNDPCEWGLVAENMRAASEVLFKAYEESTEPDGEPVRPENLHLNTPATMLYGFALENAIKGFLTKRHGSFDLAKNSNPDSWQKHRLLKLAIDTGFPLSNDQQLLLGSLEAFIVWAGRYPISMKRKQFTISKQHWSGEELTPNELQPFQIKMLEPYYNQLKEEIWRR